MEVFHVRDESMLVVAMKFHLLSKILQDAAMLDFVEHAILPESARRIVARGNMIK